MYPQPERLVAIGDLHGDLAAARKALRVARVLHPSRDEWVGGKTVVVQMGDQLDRGDEELAVLSLLHLLGEQAKTAGGALEVLVGNHEVMAAQGNFRYATDGACDDFTRWATVCQAKQLMPSPIAKSLNCHLWTSQGPLACPADDKSCQQKLQKLPERAHARYLALRPGGPL